MAIYVITILLLLFLSYIELSVSLSPFAKKALTLSMYVFLVLQVGLRWETGTDWSAYLDHFDSINSLSSASYSNASPEFGYNLAVWLVKLAFTNYSAFLLIHAAVYYGLVIPSIKYYIGMLYLPLMVLYCFTMGVEGSNRELIAVAIGLYALRYVIERKMAIYIVLVVLACMFHYSAALLLLFPFLNRKMQPVFLIFLLAVSVAIGFSQLPQSMFSHLGGLFGNVEANKAASYLEYAKRSSGDAGLSLIGLVKRMLLLTLFVYNRRVLGDKLRYYNLMLNGYIAGVIIYFLFANSLLVVVSRGDLYFNVLEPLLLASQFYLLATKSTRLLSASAVGVFSFALFIQSISFYPDIFLPYKSLVINTDFSRQMH